MSKFLLLTQREIQERLGQKGFWYMLVLGPIVVLLLLVALLKAADQGKQELSVLIADPGQIMDHRLMAQEEKNIHYYFLDDYYCDHDCYLKYTYYYFDVYTNSYDQACVNNKFCY